MKEKVLAKLDQLEANLTKPRFKRIARLLAFLIIGILCYFYMYNNTVDKNTIALTTLIISGILAYNKVDDWGWFLFLAFLLS